MRKGGKEREKRSTKGFWERQAKQGDGRSDRHWTTLLWKALEEGEAGQSSHSAKGKMSASSLEVGKTQACVPSRTRVRPEGLSKRGGEEASLGGGGRVADPAEPARR